MVHNTYKMELQEHSKKLTMHYLATPPSTDFIFILYRKQTIVVLLNGHEN